VVELSPELEAMLKTLRRDGCEYLFPTRTGAPYSESGFKSMFSRAMMAAVAEKIVTQRFTFHDLRAHYPTQHKRQTRVLPDLHADPGTTARVYERSSEARRKAL
jgi:integrase